MIYGHTIAINGTIEYQKCSKRRYEMVSSRTANLRRRSKEFLYVLRGRLSIGRMHVR